MGGFIRVSFRNDKVGTANMAQPLNELSAIIFRTAPAHQCLSTSPRIRSSLCAYPPHKHSLIPPCSRLTNVSIVRLKKGGKRFEVRLRPAPQQRICTNSNYHPTECPDRMLQKQSPGVAQWGVRVSKSVVLARAHRTLKQAHHIREKDLDEVLQISNVFMNVSKGEVAKSNDLKKSFGTDERNAIAREVSSIHLQQTET